MDCGNPGKEYENTRHNVGFKVVDKLANELNITISKHKFDALIGDGFIHGEKILLVKPQTYMNLSGNSIVQILDFYQLEPENVIVIYDDIDIALGKIKIRKSGSPGTHNGMRNITNLLASDNFPRIRIGTDKPKYQTDLANYVLQPLSKEENEILENAINNAVKAVLTIINRDIQSAMNEFNGV